MAMTDYLERLFSVDGRVGVVTGGSSGIGKAMGCALAAAGARVVLIARQATMLDLAVTEIQSAGGAAGRVSADLGDRSGIAHACERASRIFGEPDILVNAAGINLRPPLDQLPPADLGRPIAPNPPAPFVRAPH